MHALILLHTLALVAWTALLAAEWRGVGAVPGAARSVPALRLPGLGLLVLSGAALALHAPLLVEEAPAWAAILRTVLLAALVLTFALRAGSGARSLLPLSVVSLAYVVLEVGGLTGTWHP